MAHPLLKRPKRHLARCGDTGPERVPEVVEAHDPNPGSPTGTLEPPADDRSHERATGERVREDQVLFSGEVRYGAECGEGPLQFGRHRDAPATAYRLGLLELAAHERPTDANLQGRDVEVLPPEGKQLAPAKPGHRSHEIERSLEESPIVLWDAVIQDSRKLFLSQIPNVLRRLGA